MHGANEESSEPDRLAPNLVLFLSSRSDLKSTRVECFRQEAADCELQGVLVRLAGSASNDQSAGKRRRPPTRFTMCLDEDLVLAG